MLSGVRVNPVSVKAEFAVKTPHQGLPWPTCSTTGPYVLLWRIHGTKQTSPNILNPQKYKVRINANDFKDRYSIPPSSSLCGSVRSTNAEFRPTVGCQLKYGISWSLDNAVLIL